MRNRLLKPTFLTKPFVEPDRGVKDYLLFRNKNAKFDESIVFSLIIETYPSFC